MASTVFSQHAIIHQAKQIIPKLTDQHYKGQQGKIGVIGGCLEYTGAPYVAGISALRGGADLAYIFCSKEAGNPIKSYGPELIVLPVLRTAHEAGNEVHPLKQEDIIASILDWVSRLSAVVIGPGLGRDEMVQGVAVEIIKAIKKQNTIPLVIDGDGLWTVEQNPDLIRGYKKAILTPNVNEFKRLCDKVLEKDITNETDPKQTLLDLASRLGVTVVRKGSTDLISDGFQVIESCAEGGPRRCGGQGDILAGLTGAFAGWAAAQYTAPNHIKPEGNEEVLDPLMLAAHSASNLTRHCSRECFKVKKRSMLAADMVEYIGIQFDTLYEHK